MGNNYSGNCPYYRAAQAANLALLRSMVDGEAGDVIPADPSCAPSCAVWVMKLVLDLAHVDIGKISAVVTGQHMFTVTTPCLYRSCT